MARGDAVAITGCGSLDVHDILAAYDRYLGVYERTGGVGALRTLHEFSKGVFWRGVPDSAVLCGGGHVGDGVGGTGVERFEPMGERSVGVRGAGVGGVDVVGGTVEVGSVAVGDRQVVGGQCVGGERGPNFRRNDKNRKRRKAKAAAVRRGAEFSRLSASEQAKSGLDEAYVERKVWEHRLKAGEAKVALERLVKREQSGEIDRQIAITRAFQEKQLAGVVELRPNSRVAGWAKTVGSGTPSSSPSGSSGGKSVWSGLAGSQVSQGVSELSAQLEAKIREFEELRKAHDVEKKLRKHRETQLELAAAKLVKQRAEMQERGW